MTNIVEFKEFYREKKKKEIRQHLQLALGVTLSDASINYLFEKEPEPRPYDEDKPCDTE